VLINVENGVWLLLVEEQRGWCRI